MTEPLAHVGFSCKARWIGAQGLKGTRKYTLFNYSSSVAVKSSTFFSTLFSRTSIDMLSPVGDLHCSNSQRGSKS